MCTDRPILANFDVRASALWTNHGAVAQMKTSLQPGKVLMFGLVRTTILVLVAFVAGVLYERNGVSEACLGSGGNMHDGVCWNE